VSSTLQDLYPDDYPSHLWGPATRVPSRGLSCGVVRIPIIKPSDHGRLPTSHQHGDESEEEYDDSPQDPRSPGERLGYGRIPVRFVPLPSSSRSGGRRSSISVDDMGKFRHSLDPTDLGDPSGMFSRVMGSSPIGADEGFSRGGSRLTPMVMSLEILALVHTL
jgi:hypothetical protein